MKQIFLLYATDIWKRNASLIWVGTSKQKLKKFIENEIRGENVIYESDELSKREQLKHFHNDWYENELRYISDRLDYGYIDCVNDNSEV